MMNQIKPIMGGMALLIVLSTAWRYSDHPVVRGWLHPNSSTTKEIKFDNGSVRTPDVAAPRAELATPPSGVRKCVKDGTTPVYTERECPPGTKEMGLRNQANINVVAGNPAPARAAASHGLPNVRDALLSHDTQSPKDMQLERVVNR